MYERWKAMLPVAAAALALAGPPLGVRASAQPAAPSVGVVRSTDDAMQPLADPVDAALLRDLAVIAGIDAPVVSPLDYAEIELGVGCFEPSRDCLLAAVEEAAPERHGDDLVFASYVPHSPAAGARWRATVDVEGRV